MQSLALVRHVARSQVAEALQFHGRAAAMETDVRVAVADADSALAVQEREGIPCDVQLVMARDEVLDDVVADFAAGNKRHGLMTCGTGCSVRPHRVVRTVQEALAVRTTRQRRTVAAVRELDRDRSVHRRVTRLNQRVVA